MGALAFQNKNAHLLQEPPDYGFHKIIYIRGTREGYEKIKPQADAYFASSRQQNRTLQAAQAMKNRYINLKNSIYNGKIALTETDIVNMQNQWAEIVGQSLQGGGAGEIVGSTLSKMQKAIWTLKENSAKQMAQNIETYVIELENYFNGLPEKDRRDLEGMINTNELEGYIINPENGQIVLSRIRDTLNRLSQMTGAHPYTFMVNMNRELGAIAEVGDIWAIKRAQSDAENAMINFPFKNGKLTQTGTQQTQDKSGSVSTAKSDAMFTYDGYFNDQEAVLQMGLSIKATGSVVDQKTGKWGPKARPPKIQIASISRQEEVWKLLTGIYGSSTLMQNATLNTLAWANSNSNSIKLIKRNLIAHYFERFLAGSDGRLSGGSGFDIVDCLVVNGTPIPIIAILGQIMESITNSDSSSNIAYINFSVENNWKGSEKNMSMAIARSTEARKHIQKNLTMRVSLNGNILYNFAKLH